MLQCIAINFLWFTVTFEENIHTSTALKAQVQGRVSHISYVSLPVYSLDLPWKSFTQASSPQHAFLSLLLPLITLTIFFIPHLLSTVIQVLECPRTLRQHPSLLMILVTFHYSLLPKGSTIFLCVPSGG